MSPSFQPSNYSSSSSSSLKTMEEVWQDINFACLEDNSNKENNSSFPCMILQDFLATPARKHHSSAPPPAAVSDDHMDSRPATMLSLYSGSGFNYFSSESAGRNSQALTVFPSSSGGGGFDSPAAVSIVRKRPQQYEDNSATGERRHKRMIKNRESAARSRARKQESFFSISFFTFQLINKLIINLKQAF